MSDMYVLLEQWAKLNIETTLFYLIAICAIPLAFGVLFDHRIIRAGFLLIGVFGAISGIFLTLQAPFLAMAQIMIYAVGITLVVVIALMLTNPRNEMDTSPTLPLHRLPGVLMTVATFCVIYLALRSEIWQKGASAVAGGQTGASMNDVAQIGELLLTYYSLPFEFASVLLLVALIGAVMLAKADPQPVSQDRTIELEESDEERKQYVAQV